MPLNTKLIQLVVGVRNVRRRQSPVAGRRGLAGVIVGVRLSSGSDYDIYRTAPP
jgi:hypothetical protein